MIGDSITYKPNILGARFVIGMTSILILGFVILSIITRDLVFLALIPGLGVFFLYSFIFAKNMNTELVFAEAGITVRRKGKDDVFYSWEDLPYAGYETINFTKEYLILSSKELSVAEKKKILWLSITFPLGEKGVFVFSPANSARNTREVVDLIEKRYGLKYKRYG
ncbi:MAG: hypothetical protein K5857_11015 [Lachnospiraceae bacterium]|nr:hypothetical protein [Lachnospiraceae bacterium]